MEMSLRIKWCLIFIFQIRETFGSFEPCVHSGTVYKDGEYFPPNGTLFSTEAPGQCVLCRCRGGLVICETENCTALTCDTPIQMPHSCCLQCPGTAQIYDEPSDFVFNQPKPQTKKKKNDCSSGGRNYEDKSTWQPVMGPFGKMSCVECRCEGGKVICKRFRCRDLPCSHPKRQFGECCPVCPTPESIKKGGANCLPKTSEVFVYKAPNIRNNSDRIEYAFFDFKSKKQLVELHTWDTKQRGSDILHVAFVFRKEISSHNLELLGATNYKRYKKYLKREKRLQSKCIVRCAGRILRMENVLKVYHVNVRTKCNEDEVDTRTV